MRTTVASTDNAAVERNVSRSDMDKIHVIVAEINKLVTLYENLATYQLVYEKSDELKSFADVYPSLSGMFPKVEAVYPHLGAIDTLSEMTPILLNLEILAEQVSFNTNIVKNDALFISLLGDDFGCEKCFRHRRSRHRVPAVPDRDCGHLSHHRLP